MGRKGGKKGPSTTPGPQQRGSMTLRQESSGKKQGNVNAKTMCKIDHLKSLAVWAAAEASVPPLGAFFGQRLAATSEMVGLRPDPSVFVCGRCESILQPGHNCTVRIEKNKSKGRHRRKKSNVATKNNVVYRCHFCSHRNFMRGTPKGYVKEICPKGKPPLSSDPAESVVENPITLPKAASLHPREVDTVAPPRVVDTVAPPRVVDTVAPPIIVDTVAPPRVVDNFAPPVVVDNVAPPVPVVVDNVAPPVVVDNVASPVVVDNVASPVVVDDVASPVVVDNVASPRVAENNQGRSSPSTPLLRTGLSLLDSKRRKRNRSTAKKAAESVNSLAAADEDKSIHKSQKRRRKSWTSLNEIARSSEHDNRKFTNLTIPFFF